MDAQIVISPAPANLLATIGRELERDPKLVSAHTRRSYQHDLAAFEAWRGGRALSKLLVEEFAVHLRTQGRAPSSINRALSAVRWWAKRIGDLAYEDAGMERSEREEIVTQAARVRAVENVKGTRLPKGRKVEDGEVRRLLTGCASDAGMQGLRDGAILALAWATGARQAELTGILIADLVLDADKEEGLVTLRGKGDKERAIAFYDSVYLVLADWLAVRGELAGYLFCPLRRGGRLSVRSRLGHETMRQILQDRAAQARLTAAVTWHDFRRTFIGNLLDNQVDLATAQRLAGHADPKTTSAYDRRGEEVQRAAVRNLRLPYQRRTLEMAAD